MTPFEPTADLEAVYDEQIAPLMTRIIATCKEHGIPLVASFQLTGEEARPDEDGPLYCTTYLLPEGCSEKLIAAKRALLDNSASFVAMTITTEQARGDTPLP